MPMNEIKMDIVLSAIGHDPAGWWAEYFPRVTPVVDNLYTHRLISFTKGTSPITSYEDWIFDGLSSDESARRKSTPEDFIRRGIHVSRILQTADRAAKQLGLTTGDISFDSIVKSI